MREIKFRGRTINNKWVYGDLLNFSCAPGLHFIGTQHDGSIPVVTETVGQFTGLRDKNGQEIYEGDIVRHCIGEGHEWSGIHEVIFMHGAFIIRGGNPHGSRYGEAFNWYPMNVVVIGNVHETPEFLK